MPAVFYAVLWNSNLAVDVHGLFKAFLSHLVIVFPHVDLFPSGCADDGFIILYLRDFLLISLWFVPLPAIL
jgi:hypothetical protein